MMFEPTKERSRSSVTTEAKLRSALKNVEKATCSIRNPAGSSKENVTQVSREEQKVLWCNIIDVENNRKSLKMEVSFRQIVL